MKNPCSKQGVFAYVHLTIKRMENQIYLYNSCDLFFNFNAGECNCNEGI